MPQCEAVVNVFQSAIGDPERFHPERHIALEVVLPAFDAQKALPGLLSRLEALYPLPRRKELELLEL